MNSYTAFLKIILHSFCLLLLCGSGSAYAQVSNVKITSVNTRLTSGGTDALSIFIDLPNPCQNVEGPVSVETNTNRVTREQLELLYTAAVTAWSTGASVTFVGNGLFQELGDRCVSYLGNRDNPGFTPHMTVDIGGNRKLEIVLAP